MALKKNGRVDVVKTAISKGYKWNSDGTVLTKSEGGRIKFSETGGSVSVGTSTYSTAHDAKNSSSL